jgi:hypothetical protein
MQSRWNTDSPGFNKDLYTYKNELRTISKPTDLVVVGNDVSQFIFLYYIDRKGWVFNENQLDATNATTDDSKRGKVSLYRFERDSRKRRIETEY